MKPVAYISDGGVIFKESPFDSILKLSPLYTSAEIQELHNLVKEQQAEIKAFKLRKLTDEEIRDIFYTSPYLKKGETITYADFYFARAILKKASK